MAPSPVHLLVSDLDGTLLSKEPTSARRFAAFWRSLPARRRPQLCYSSGRLGPDVHAGLPSSGLPVPDFVIGGVGTSLTDGAGHPIAGFTDRLRDGWDRGLVQEVVAQIDGVTPQPLRFQSPFKSSWFWLNASPTALADLEARLASLELRTLVVYSSERDLDVLPVLGGKGHALAWLCTHLGQSARHVVAAGDSENDLAMFRVPGVRSIVVANATPGLRTATRRMPVYRASAASGAGVIEGLRAFGLGVPAARHRPARPQRSAS